MYLKETSNRTYSYDQHNHLLSVNDVGLNFSSIYDANGRRVQVNDGNTIRQIIYDGHAEIASYENNVLKEEYVIGIQPDGRIMYSRAGANFIIHHDLFPFTELS